MHPRSQAARRKQTPLLLLLWLPARFYADLLGPHVLRAHPSRPSCASLTHPSARGAVAINALMRVLREPSAATLHGKAVAALFDIIKAMGLSFVPYLPKASALLAHSCRARLSHSCPS